MSNPIDTLGLNCPNGGDFYVCQNSEIRFLGCCASDPCADGSGDCPQSDLRYSSFDVNEYEYISNQTCSGKGKWYGCPDLDPPFLGCCSVNACNYEDGCPAKSLVAAELSSNTESAAVFETTTEASTAKPTTKPTATSSPARSSSAASTAATTATSTASALSMSSTWLSSTVDSSTTSSSSVSTPANTSASASESSPSGLSKGAISGVSIAGTLFFVALIAALFFCGRRKWRERTEGVEKGPEPPTPTNPYLYHDPNRVLHTPPPFQPQPNSQDQVLTVVNKSPTHNSSRFNSVSSMTSNNQSWQGLPTSPATLREDYEQHQPFIPNPQPLETVAELEGTGISMPLVELPGDSQPCPRSIYRPYRPSVGIARDF